MKIPLQIGCQSCGKPATVKFHLDAPSLDWKCCTCGQTNAEYFASDLTIGHKVLERSRYELVVEGDYSLSIILAATALECELSHLFRKWTEIEHLESNRDFGEEDCQRLLRDFKNIAEKIQTVSHKMDPRGIDGFVRSSPDLEREIQQNFPNLRIGSLARDFQKEVFWPRNRILHAGFIGYTEDEAVRCYKAARLGLVILRDMDITRGSR